MIIYVSVCVFVGPCTLYTKNSIAKSAKNDFHIQPSLGFLENSFKRRKYPVSSTRKVLADVWGQRLDWESWLEHRDTIVERTLRVYDMYKGNIISRTYCRALLDTGYWKKAKIHLFRQRQQCIRMTWKKYKQLKLSLWSSTPVISYCSWSDRW